MQFIRFDVIITGSPKTGPAVRGDRARGSASYERFNALQVDNRERSSQ
jgi:hypothetical protein